MNNQTPPKSSVPIILGLIIVVLLIVIGFLLYKQQGIDESTQTNLDQGLESSETPQTSLDQEISVTSPAAGSPVHSPIFILGSASGTWFFEGSFPVVLEDQQGKELARGVVQASQDWMTENQVSFTSNLTFSVNQPTPAVLIFTPDNPSGLPNDTQFELPVVLLPE